MKDIKKNCMKSIIKDKLKVINCILLIFTLTATIFIQPVLVNANDSKTANTIIINPSYNNSTGRLSVSGKINNGGNVNVTIKIIDPSGKLLYIDEVKSKADGTFNFTGAKTSEEGLYKIYVGSEITEQAEMVSFRVSKAKPEEPGTDPGTTDPGTTPGTTPGTGTTTKPGTETKEGEVKTIEEIITQIDDIINKIEDISAEEMINTLEQIIKQSGNLAQEEKGSLNEKLTSLIEKTIDKISTLDINKLAEDESGVIITEEESKKKVEINDEIIDNIINQYNKIFHNLQQALNENGFGSIADSIKQFENNKEIKVIFQDSEKELELVLSVKSINNLSKNSVGLRIESALSFILTPDSLDIEQIINYLKDEGWKNVDEESLNNRKVAISIKNFNEKEMEREPAFQAANEMTKGKNTFKQASKIFDINIILLADNDSKQSATYIKKFKNKLVIEISLDNSLLNKGKISINSKKLGIYRYDPDKKSWRYVGGKVDPDTGRVYLKTDHLSIYGAFEYHKTYSDIQSSWAKEYIEILSAKQIVSGINDELFQPDRNVTRAEFAKMIVEAFGFADTNSGAKASFIDVSNEAWYYNYVAIAQSLGIVKGLPGNRFDPEGKINRQDMAVMAHRAANIAGIELAKVKEYKEFNDSSQISDFAKEAVKEMQMAGILEGDGSGVFKPLNNATRAEAAKIIYMLAEAMQ